MYEVGWCIDPSQPISLIAGGDVDPGGSPDDFKYVMMGSTLVRHWPHLRWRLMCCSGEGTPANSCVATDVALTHRLDL